MCICVYYMYMCVCLYTYMDVYLCTYMYMCVKHHQSVQLKLYILLNVNHTPIKLILRKKMKYNYMPTSMTKIIKTWTKF